MFNNDAARIAELQDRIGRLMKAGRVVIAQRDAWEVRALSAEARLNASGESTSGSGQRKFALLKKLIAKELHPDQSQGQGIDLLVREAIFKRIWPLVLDIEEKN